ncbi:alpha/beta fold hydrolase [Micromonospora sp. CPCC 205371]|nr:alpha/beta fold hydrolase [Micromonospora sp. CPCC 205371]
MSTKEYHLARRRGRALRAGLIAAAAAAVLGGGLTVANAGSSGAGSSGEEGAAEQGAVAAAHALASPDLEGANDFECVASPAIQEDADDPEPVILVHDTFRDGASNFAVLAPELTGAGLCVFALDYGGNGTAPLADSAAQLQTFVAGVLEATGAPKVDLVGHGQGGLLPRVLVGPLGLAEQVDDIVAIAPATRGTDTPLEDPDFAECAACADLAPDSEFLAQLNANGDVVPGPAYTVPWSIADDVITPPDSQTLKGGEPEQVNNERMEFACLGRLDFNHALDQELAVADIVLSAVQREGPSDPGLAFRPARC